LAERVIVAELDEVQHEDEEWKGSGGGEGGEW
jgi:hypothetical protein